MSKWIKCVEKMPSYGQKALICDDGDWLIGESTDSVKYDMGIFWTYDKNEGFSIKSYVSHWMPLPQPAPED